MIKKIDKSDLNHKHVNICTKGLERNLVFQIKMKLRKRGTLSKFKYITLFTNEKTSDILRVNMIQLKHIFYMYLFIFSSVW